MGLDIILNAQGEEKQNRQNDHLPSTSVCVCVCAVNVDKTHFCVIKQLCLKLLLYSKVSLIRSNISVKHRKNKTVPGLHASCILLKQQNILNL